MPRFVAELLHAGQVLLIPILVLCNAFFVAAEFSLVTVRRTRLEELASKPGPGHGVRARIARPARALRRGAAAPGGGRLRGGTNERRARRALEERLQAPREEGGGGHGALEGRRHARRAFDTRADPERGAGE